MIICCRTNPVSLSKGGGFVFQPGHSVPSSISGKHYDDVVSLVEEYGKYPLQVGEYDLCFPAAA